MNVQFCPHCGIKLTADFAFCPGCGTRLASLRSPADPPAGPDMPAAPAAPQSPAPQMPARQPRPSCETCAVDFACSQTGMVIASAKLPKGFWYNGLVRRNGENDFTRIPDMVKAWSDDKHTVLFSESRHIWEEYVSAVVKSLTRMSGTNTSNERKFMDPEVYLRKYGEEFVQAKLTPAAFTKLPGAFAANRQQILNDMLSTFLARDGSQPNVQMNIINAVCEPLLMKFTGVKDGRNIVVMVGCEYMGIEYRNDINPAMMMGGAAGLLGGMLVNQVKKAADKKAGSVLFGHSKNPDIIRWGYRRIYLCQADAGDEGRAAEAFWHFVTSFRENANLAQQRAQDEYQVFLRGLRQAQAYAQQARQYQAMAQQRAMETSRIIARNSEEISAGIMDSWNRKMASDSRISANYSEAVRGVNTYQTTYGRSVEVDVAADHVYENRYGDVYGVSGVVPDQETLNRLDWTEIG